MPNNNHSRRKKDSARLIWDSKPRRAPNPKDIEFQTAEIVIPNPHRDQTALSYFTEDLTHPEIDKSGTNRLIWGANLLAMQTLLARSRLPQPEHRRNSEEAGNIPLRSGSWTSLETMRLRSWMWICRGCENVNSK